jgi:hypothetical protein
MIAWYWILYSLAAGLFIGSAFTFYVLTSSWEEGEDYEFDFTHHEFDFVTDKKQKGSHLKRIK